MKRILLVIVVLSLIGIISGCAVPIIAGTKAPIENIVTSPPVGNFNERMKNLADQINKNLYNNTPGNTFIITSITNLDKLSDTTALGRLISENLIHGLQVHKWQIVEARLTKGIDVNAAGEFSLSRDINKLKDEYKITGVVTGTYSVAEGNLTINVRVIDINTGIVISSGQTYIPVISLPETSYSIDNSTKSMKIISDGIK